MCRGWHQLSKRKKGKKRKKKASGCSIGSAAAPSYCSLWVNAGTKTQTVHVLKRCTSWEALVLFTTALAFLQWAVYCQNLKNPNYLDTVDKRCVESTSNGGFFHTVLCWFHWKIAAKISAITISPVSLISSLFFTLICILLYGAHCKLQMCVSAAGNC